MRIDHKAHAVQLRCQVKRKAVEKNMYVFGVFAVMIAVGALIGAVTNHFAIKMLFRPYKAVYIFGKRVPFTPGLIPKRRDELARQMGQMVTGHLLTTEGIKKGLHPMRLKARRCRLGSGSWRTSRNQRPPLKKH